MNYYCVDIIHCGVVGLTLFVLCWLTLVYQYGLFVVVIDKAPRTNLRKPTIPLEKEYTEAFSRLISGSYTKITIRISLV